MSELEVVYSCPDAFAAYERHVLDCVGRSGIARKLDRVALLRRTRLGVFVSDALPTVVVLRRGEVLSAAIGELPVSELRRMLARALPAASSTHRHAG